MSKFSQIVSNLFKISLITLVVIIAVASVITGFAYLNSVDYQIKSQVGKIYNITYEGSEYSVEGSIKIISTDELSVDLSVSPSDGRLISYEDKDASILLGIIDEDDFLIGRFTIESPIRVNTRAVNEVATAFEGLQFSNLIKISNSNKKALLSAYKINYKGSKFMETIIDPDSDDPLGLFDDNEK
jgi:hypothetical protein